MSFQRDGLSEFIEKAGQIRVLTKVEEVELAKRIEKGDHAAKQRLVEHNIRLAISVARKYSQAGVPLEDLIQEALIGVDRAAEKFDWRKGLKFSTYAMWWIRHFIQRALHKNRATIRIPGHIVERKRKIDKYMREHPDADLAEAAAAIEVTLTQAEEALEVSRVVSSLDAPFADDETGDRYAIIADEDAPDPADIAVDNTPELTAALDKLPPLEREVIELRFGFHGPVKGRDEVAEILGIKPHAVQRAQRSALELLEADDALAAVSRMTAGETEG